MFSPKNQYFWRFNIHTTALMTIKVNKIATKFFTR